MFAFPKRETDSISDSLASVVPVEKCKNSENKNRIVRPWTVVNNKLKFDSPMFVLKSAFELKIFADKKFP